MGFCSVRWCGKASNTSSYEKDGITFHRFPKCATRKEKWIDATHRGDKWFPVKTSVICSRHFTPDCFHQMNQRRRLMDSAVPTLFLPILTPDPAAVTVPVLELHAHDLDESASGNEIHDSTMQDPLSLTSQPQRNLLQPPPNRKRTRAPESHTAFDCPAKQRLCRRILELKNVVKEKTVKLRKLRDANRRLKRRIISLESRLGEQDTRN